MNNSHGIKSKTLCPAVEFIVIVPCGGTLTFPPKVHYDNIITATLEMENLVAIHFTLGSYNVRLSCIRLVYTLPFETMVVVHND